MFLPVVILGAVNALLHMLVRLGSSAFWPACCQKYFPPSCSFPSLPQAPRMLHVGFFRVLLLKVLLSQSPPQPHHDIGSVLGLIFLNTSHWFSVFTMPTCLPLLLHTSARSPELNWNVLKQPNSPTPTRAPRPAPLPRHRAIRGGQSVPEDSGNSRPSTRRL